MRLLILALALALACSPSDEPPGPAARDDRLQVFVVNYPLAYFAERVGGDQVRVIFPVPRGVDPSQWSPDGASAAAFQSADLVLLNGAGYAGWVTRIALPRSRLVETSSAVRDQWIPLPTSPLLRAARAGALPRGEWEVEIWLDPILALAQVRAIAEALASERPERAESFGAEMGALEQELRDVDQRIADAASPLQFHPVLYAQPMYAYLERRYGLRGRSLDWDAGRMPDARTWVELEGVLDDHPARLVIWDRQPLPEIEERLASLGLRSTVFDPCANAPDEGDWLSVMRANAERLAAATDR